MRNKTSIGQSFIHIEYGLTFFGFSFDGDMAEQFNEFFNKFRVNLFALFRGGKTVKRDFIGLFNDSKNIAIFPDRRLIGAFPGGAGIDNSGFYLSDNFGVTAGKFNRFKIFIGVNFLL